MNQVAKIMALFALVIAAVASNPASAQSISVELTTVSGDGFTSGSTFVVRAAVTANTTGIAPSAASLRLTFPNTLLQFQSVVGTGNLGPAVASLADEFTSPPVAGQAFRDISNIGPTSPDPFPATNLTPALFEVTFLVLEQASVAGALDLALSLDPDTDNPFPTFDLDPISPTFGQEIVVVDPDDPSAITFTNVSLTGVDNWLELHD